MGNSKSNKLLTAVYAALLVLSFYKVNGQISTPCTTSMISSFTPCLNFITGSSGTGQSSPSADCCDSVRSIMSNSVDCTCLIITGNVPLSLPFNRTLAISLPQACNGGLPIRCRSSGVPLPAPGPALFVPPPPEEAPTASVPAHAPSHHHARPPSHSPRASKASSTLAPSPVDTAPGTTPAVSHEPAPSLAPAAHPGIRPVLNPAPSASASALSYNFVPSFLVIILIPTIVHRGQLY